MNFFRSEEMARTWAHEHGTPVRPIVTMAQLWKLAATWYASRLEPNARRPRPEEIPVIFASIGFTDEFWNPMSAPPKGSP